MQAYTKYYLGIDSEGESSVSSLVSDGHSVSHQVSYLLPTCIELCGRLPIEWSIALEYPTPPTCFLML